MLSGHDQRNALLTHMRRCRTIRGKADAQEGADHARETKYKFLQVPLCSRAFAKITGVNPWRARKQVAAGEVRYAHAGFKRRKRPHWEQMYIAIYEVIKHYKNPAPLARTDPDQIELPFHEKIYLYRSVP